MVKYSELYRTLKRNGWHKIRQRGSHMIMIHPEKTEQVTFPYHAGKEVKKGLLKSILKQTGIKLEKDEKKKI